MILILVIVVHVHVLQIPTRGKLSVTNVVSSLCLVTLYADFSLKISSGPLVS